MSELLQNREFLKDFLKNIVRRLESGKTAEEVDAEIRLIVENVTNREFFELMQGLQKEGISTKEIGALYQAYADTL